MPESTPESKTDSEAAGVDLRIFIRAAIPDADDELCRHILWARTPYPIVHVSARAIYKAAHRLKRAEKSGIDLCEHCDSKAEDGFYTCFRCALRLGKRYPLPEKQRRRNHRWVE